MRWPIKRVNACSPASEGEGGEERKGDGVREATTTAN